MSNIQSGRDFMAVAEMVVRANTASRSPGDAAAHILRVYTGLTTEEERRALVAVLATKAAISCFNGEGRFSPSTGCYWA